MKLRDRIWRRWWRTGGSFFANEPMPVPLLLFWRAVGLRLTGQVSPLSPPSYGVDLNSFHILHPLLRDSLAGAHLTHWGMDVACINVLTGLISKNRFRHIIEFGSGISTIVLATLCRELAGAENAESLIFSFDQSADYASKTRGELHARGLQGVANVRHCPLGSRSIGSEQIQGYRWETSLSDVLPDGWTADLILVDGPSSGGLARAAAAQDALACAKAGCMLLMDDGLRDDEIRCMRYLHDRNAITFHGVIPVGKGLAVGRVVGSR